MSHDDFDFEPIRGLPALLPPGEKLLWQGSPRWQALAIRAYHVRKVAIYFLALVGWRIAIGISAAQGLAAIGRSCLMLVLLGGIATGILSLLAYLNARSTVYSITSRRVLLRHGIAVPLTLNLPFCSIDNAALRLFAGGTGDIALRPAHGSRVGYLINWPHVRPGRFAHPEPSLRALSDAAPAAKLLGTALSAAAGAADQPAGPLGRPVRASDVADGYHTAAA